MNLDWLPVSVEDLELIELWRVNGKCKKHNWKYQGVSDLDIHKTKHYFKLSIH